MEPDDIDQLPVDDYSFLKLNHLSNKVYASRLDYRIWRGVLIYVIPFAVFIFMMTVFPDTGNLKYAIPLAALGIGFVSSSSLKLHIDPSYGPHYIFSAEGLETTERLIPWRRISRWEYYPAQQKGDQPYMLVSGPEIAIKVDIDNLAITEHDFYKLLSYYRSKYGNTCNE